MTSEHRPNRWADLVYCVFDREPWPCPTYAGRDERTNLPAQLAASEAQRATLAAELAISRQWSARWKALAALHAQSGPHFQRMLTQATEVLAQAGAERNALAATNQRLREGLGRIVSIQDQINASVDSSERVLLAFPIHRAIERARALLAEQPAAVGE